MAIIIIIIFPVGGTHRAMFQLDLVDPLIKCELFLWSIKGKETFDTFYKFMYTPPTSIFEKNSTIGLLPDLCLFHQCSLHFFLFIGISVGSMANGFVLQLGDCPLVLPLHPLSVHE